jgi:predicted ATPase/DNA-binding SARP family transcriptional activator
MALTMTKPDTSSPSRMEILLFGPMDVRVNGASVMRDCVRKARHLLALLALRAGHEVERAWLAGTLWPESAERQAHSNLREVLHDLRQVLAEESSRLRSPTRRTLYLDVAGAQVDVLAFDAARRRGDLEAMVSLYRGPLLEDCTDEWVLGERPQREQAYLQAREQLAEAALQTGDAAGARVHLRSVIGVDPLRENAQRSLMQALAADGNYAAAVQVYRDLRLLLHRELQAEPDPATTALFQRLRAQAKRQAQAAHTPLAPPTAQPLIRLPQPVSSLVGREQEIAEVSASLSCVRLLTLTGAGGVGKTRLAIATAEAVADDYPDGVCFVDLAPLSDPALIPQTIASALEVREEPGRSLLETLRHFLQSKALLLVLDNCEHLLEGCVSVAGSLLEGGKHLKILATSRQFLGVTGELVWRVPSLPVPPVHALPAAEKEPVGVWLEYASVQLFVDRAQLVAPAFRLSRVNAGSVAAICQQLEGIPLALELAATWLRSLSVEELRTHLHDRFGLLRRGSRAALPRQQTLRATVDWSYDLLSDPERTLLRRLSVFVGGWTLEAAEQVCALQGRGKREEGRGDSSFILHPSSFVLDLLTTLVDKSLAQAEVRERGTRYRLLETIRQYGQERLAASGEEAPLRDRHLHYFLGLAEAAEPHLTGADQAVWLERLETEHDNMRAALDWIESRHATRDTRPPVEAGLRLAGALWQFWMVHGHLSEGRAYLMDALGHVGTAKQTQVRATALNGAGVLAYHQGDYDTARSFHEQSLAIWRELGDKQGIAASLRNLGNISTFQRDYEAARALYEESLAIRRELGDKQGIAISLGNLGNIAFNQGDYGTARALYEEALVILRELGHKGGIALALNNLGNVVQALGDYGAARALYEDGLAIRQELGHKQGIAVSLGNLGSIACDQGDYATARALYEQSLEIGREMGDKVTIAWSLCLSGNVAQAQGDSGAARALYEQSLALFRELGEKGGIGSALMNLGNVACSQGDYEAARALYEESLSIRYKLGHSPDIADSLEAFARLMQAANKPQRAARLWGATTLLRNRIGSRRAPDDQRKYDQQTEQARATLGEAAFIAAYEEGGAMTLEQAVEYALHHDEAIEPGED